MNRTLMTTEKFARRILEMGSCKFSFYIEACDYLLTVAKIILGKRQIVLFVDEFNEKVGNKNYTMAFGVDGFSNDFGEEQIIDKAMAIKSIINGLNSYKNKSGLTDCSWIWDDELFEERVLINISYDFPDLSAEN